VVKAMAPSPEDRYASAEDLGDDIARLLDGHPVTARDLSLAYVVRKTVTRHRGVFTMAAVALALLVAALVGAIWQGRVAAAERERAVRRFNDVRELAGALIFQIHDEVAPLAGSTPVRRTIVAQGLEFLHRLERDADGDEALQTELAAAYVRIGHVQGRLAEANLGDREGALRSYRKARELVRPVVQRRPASWEATVTAVDADLALAAVLKDDEARAACTTALEMASAWHAREPQSSRSRSLLARVHFQMAVVLGYPQSLPHWQQVERLFSAVLAEDPSNPGKIRNAALGQKYLGSYYEVNRELDKALEHFRAALALDERRMQAQPSDRQAQLDYAIDVGNIANVQLNRGEYAAAIDAYKRSLDVRQRIADADPKDVYAQGRVSFVLMKLATLYARTDDIPRAHDHVSRAMALIEPLAAQGDSYGHQHFNTLRTLADVERLAGRRTEACHAYRRAQRMGLDETRTPELSEPIRHIAQAVSQCDRGAKPTAIER
jgi:eukaryotic-like serine/threonine-protein kinase